MSVGDRAFLMASRGRPVRRVNRRQRMHSDEPLISFESPVQANGVCQGGSRIFNCAGGGGRVGER